MRCAMFFLNLSSLENFSFDKMEVRESGPNRPCQIIIRCDTGSSQGCYAF